MLEFFAGFALGFAVLSAAEVWRGSRVSKKRRRQLARFADFQEAVFDVQDCVARHSYWPTNDVSVLNYREQEWIDLKGDRDQALAAYLAAMGE